MTREVALVTCAGLPELDADDAPLVDAFRARGWSPRIVLWDDAAVNWTGYRAVVLRSTWDYHLRVQEYREWIRGLESQGALLLNPASRVLWNLDKARYLAELEQAGVRLVPTVRVPVGGARSLSSILAAHGWKEAVVKPAESADGYRTLRVHRDRPEAGEELLRQIVAEGVALVQAYRHEVETEGEWSFLFFGGLHSHTTLKRPAAGEFRVQDTYGGTRASVDPPAEVLAQARGALVAAGGEDLLYARVDGLRVQDSFEVMEVELIEPSLYFDGHAERADRFVDAFERLAPR